MAAAEHAAPSAALLDKLAAIQRGTAEQVKVLIQKGDEEILAYRDKIREGNVLFLAAMRQAGSAADAREICRYLVEDLGMDVNATGGVHTLSQTPLYYAASQGFPQVAEYLLDRGSSLEALDAWGMSPVFWAAKNANADTLEFLLGRRADVGRKSGQAAIPVPDQSALFLAAGSPPPNRPANAETQCRCLKALLEAKCVVDEQDAMGQTPLFYAAAKSLGEKVDMLLKNSASIHHQDKNGDTALHYATRERNVGTCRLLLDSRADPHKTNSHGVSPLHLLNGRPELDELFARFQAKRPASAPATAKKKPRRVVPRVPTTRKRRPSAVDAQPEGDDDAMSAVGSCVSSVAPGLDRQQPVLAQEQWPRPTELPEKDLSPLSRAVLCGSAAEVEGRVAEGHSLKELNIRTGGNLVLVASMRLDRDDAAARDTCRLLVESHKVPVTYIDNQRQTALIHAAQRGLVRCVEYLIEARCDPAHRDAADRTALHHASALDAPGCAGALLRASSVEVNARDKDGRTPLCVAAAFGSPRSLSLLLEQGAEVGDALLGAAAACVQTLTNAGCDPNAASSDGRLPLLAAAAGGSVEKVAALVSARADLQRREEATGRTAFHEAVKGKHLDLCRALLCTHGADVYAKDVGGKTPLDEAKRYRWSGAKELDEMVKKHKQAKEEEQRAKAARRVEQRRQLAEAVKHGPLEQVRDLLQAAGASLREPLEADPAVDASKLLPLHAAAARAVPAEQGDAAEACRLLVDEGGLDPSELNGAGQTALFEAAAVGHVAACEYLARHPTGRGVNAADKDGRTALFNAARCGHSAALSKLLECGASLTLTDKQDQTALFPAARILTTTAEKKTQQTAARCVGLLVAARALPDATDQFGRCPLSYAAQDGADEVARSLAAARANVNAQDKMGRSALFYAVREARGQTARMLLQEFGARPPGRGDKPIQDDGRGNVDLFDMAQDRGFPEVVTLLEEALEKHGKQMALWETLVKAVREGSAEDVDRVIGQKADVHRVDGTGRTPLHLAAARVDERGIECCERLIATHKLDVNAHDHQQDTPLFSAAREGSEPVLALLLDSSADPALRNQKGESALFAAAQMGRAPAAALLLRRGARADHRDSGGQTAAFHAKRSGCAAALRCLLEDASAPRPDDAVDHDRCTPLFGMEDTECALVLLEKGYSLEAKNNAGRTPLFAAAEGNRVDMVKFLLEHKAEASAVAADGRTALHVSSGSAVPRLLLEARVAVDLEDRNKQTALFFAAARDDEAMVHTLALSGADGDVRDVNGQSALFYAAQKASREVVRKLVCQAFADPSAVDNEHQSPYQIAKDFPHAKAGVAEYLEELSRPKRRKPRKPTKVEAEQTRRYCLVFDDPSDPTGATRIPFGTPAYEAALSRLTDALPQVFRDVWPTDLPPSRGPPDLETKA